jgi:hypothetical protein
MDDDRLLIHEVDPYKDHKTYPSDPKLFSPFRVRVSVLDANSGRSLLSKEWPTSVHNSSVDLFDDGIVLRTGATLRLLDKNLAELQDITFREDDYDPHWGLIMSSVSPSGRTLMINRINQSANVSYLEAFDKDNLAVRHSWRESPALYHLYTISDSEIAALAHSQDQLVRTPLGRSDWKKSPLQFRPGCLNLPTFIADDRLVVQDCDRLLLIDKEGGSNFIYRLHETESFDSKIAFSSTGRFIAFSVAHANVKKHLFAEPTARTVTRRIVVYDLPTKGSILTVSVDPLPRNDYDFALSPNGSRLAILNDRTVSVYSVPVKSVEDTNTSELGIRKD